MFKIFRNKCKNKDIEPILNQLNMNLANNYKDEAQVKLKELEAMFARLCDEGVLSDTQKKYYEDIITGLKGQMKDFTHKDQKPTWTGFKD